MFKFIPKGNDMFKSGCEALINTTNTTGVMGAGIAKQMMDKYPEICKEYNSLCKKGGLSGGDIFIQPTEKNNPKWIIQFATKQEVWNPARLEYVEKGLGQLAKTIEKHEIKSIVIPPLGCGLGGLDWDEVKPMVVEKLSHLVNKCDIYVYEPW